MFYNKNLMIYNLKIYKENLKLILLNLLYNFY